MIKIKDFFNIKWLIVAVIFTAVVVLLTHVPEDAMPSPLCVSSLDKLEHGLAYGVITFLFIMSLSNSLTVLSALFLFFAILAIGVIDELTQSLVNRTASVTDLLANAMGIATILLCFVWFKNSKRQASMNADI